MATKPAVKKPSAESKALAHLVPDIGFSESYISRMIDGVSDVGLLGYAMQTKANTVISGPTGPGKTSLVIAYCAKKKLPVATVQCHGAIDPASFWGGLVMDSETGTYIWQDSEITQIIRHGGVLYLDEVNFMPAKVSATFHGLLDKRRQITILEKGNEVIEAHENLQIVASYNPDYEGTKPLNAAFKNRFKLKLRFDYDPVIESSLLCLPVMQELAGKLRMAHAAGDIETPISTNMLIEFEEIAVDLGYEFAMNNFVNAFPEDERQTALEVFELHGERIRKEIKEMEEMIENESE